jgi:hypothetical protein
MSNVATPLWEECEDETHTFKRGTWESVETPEILEFDYRGQNTSNWSVLYTIRKLSKHTCWKWACMSHLDICSTSYGKNKSPESNWQFDFRPPKVENWPDPEACKWSATRHWKAFNESYKFASNFIPIEGLNKKLWLCKMLRVQTGTISGLLLGSPGIKRHSNVGATERRRKYYMGKGGGFPQVQAVVSLVSPELPVACPSTKGVVECELTNLFVGLMQVQVSKWNFSLLLVPS